MTVAKKRLFCGCGPNVAVLTLTGGLELEKHWIPANKNNVLVSNIAIGKYAWISCKDSSTVTCWDIDKGVKRATFDCSTALHKRYGKENISSRDSRIVSMYLQSKDALWLGTGGGHVILIEPTVRCDLIAIVARHTSAVRCLTATSGTIRGKPVSLILTGGMGFKDRPNAKKEDVDFGYVLIWENDLALQYKHLENERKHREDLIRTHWQS